MATYQERLGVLPAIVPVIGYIAKEGYSIFTDYRNKKDNEDLNESGLLAMVQRAQTQAAPPPAKAPDNTAAYVAIGGIALFALMTAIS